VRLVMDVPKGPPPARVRRPRYRGTHPRRFDEKYKELTPDRHPALIDHVREAGKTPAGQHVPVLVDEVLEILSPQPGERGIDATLGWGGHAECLLRRLQPGGHLLAIDADPLEIAKAETRLRRAGFDADALTVRRTNFAGLRAAVDSVGWHDGADVIIADLGVSSMQIDDPTRGFSFKLDGPLDMRMHPTRGRSAADWLARASADAGALAAVLQENADEPDAADIAQALAGRAGALKTTRALAEVVRHALGRRRRRQDVEASLRRVFQAIRIEVNDEFGALDALLRQLPGCLRTGGRVAVLTFHSGEDRRVKRAFDQGAREGWYGSVSREVIRPSAAERRANPRANPAKLRWARLQIQPPDAPSGLTRK
jgi:16S rRNA (cytosine1402-N4)-methyltransferase